MNILQLVDSLNAGGAERMAVNISNVLAVNQHDVVLCVSRSPGTLERFIDVKVQVEFLKKKCGFDLVAFVKLLIITHKKKIEIIHAHSSSIYWAVMVKLFFPGIKLIWHDHYGKSDFIDNSQRKGIQFFSRFFDGIIVVNDKLLDWSLKYTKVAKAKIQLINNFPLLSKGSINTQKDNSVVYIIYLANFRPQKDHITLVNAINVLVNEFGLKNINVCLAGIYQYDEYYLSVLEQIKKCNLQSYFQIPGTVKDITNLLVNSDIGVLSSVSEGLPVSLLEYGITGLPVVVTNVGQCAEVLENGKYGIIVPSNNPESLSNALKSLIQNEDLRKAMGAKFKEHVESQYGYKNFLTQYNSLIGLIIK